MEKRFQNSYNENKLFSGAFINNDSFKPLTGTNQDSAIGNTGEEIIKTCCEELGFKCILINSIKMVRRQRSIVNFVMECTQSERLNFMKKTEEDKTKKTVLVFEDIDNVFSDEAGFYSAVVKCLENSKVPIILTSHKHYEESEIIKRSMHRGLKVKHINRFKCDSAAIKLQIRTHIIVLFECIINKYVTKLLEKYRENEETEIPLDLNELEIEEQELTPEKLTINHSYIKALLKHMEFDMNR